MGTISIAIIALFVGTVIGFVIACLLTMSRLADWDAEIERRTKEGR